MSEKRNIILVTLDSVRADHCSFMGYHREITPTIDKMARRGIYFENAIASSVGTPASLVGVFTGEYSLVDSTETKPEPWREEIRKRKTLAQILSKLGYATCAFNPNAFVSSYFGFNKGFKYFNDFLNKDSNFNFFKKIHKRLFEKVAKSGRKGKSFVLRNLVMLLFKEEIFKSWECYYDDILDWVNKVKEPFFLWILLIDTHHPYLAPRKYRKYSNFFKMWYSNWKLQKVGWRSKLSEKEKRWLIDAYDDSIYYVDVFIKKLWHDLKDKDPIFIIHADHGEGFSEHGFYGHGPYLYEELIHVPLVIFNADIDIKGKVLEEPVSLIGLAPTILELIGERNEFSSKNILQESDGWVISKVFEGGKRKVAVRMKCWKFITGQKDKDELYNLNEDPLEQENLIDQYPNLANEFKKIIKIQIKQENEIEKIKRNVSKLIL